MAKVIYNYTYLCIHINIDINIYRDNIYIVFNIYVTTYTQISYVLIRINLTLIIISPRSSILQNRNQNPSEAVQRGTSLRIVQSGTLANRIIAFRKKTKDFNVWTYSFRIKCQDFNVYLSKNHQQVYGNETFLDSTIRTEKKRLLVFKYTYAY